MEKLVVQETPAIFPVPRSMKMVGLGFLLSSVVGIVAAKGADPSAVREVERTLKAAGVKRIEHHSDLLSGKTPVTIFIGSGVDHPAFKNAIQALNLNVSGLLPKEGYLLAAGHALLSRGIVLLAGTDARATYYAAQTFRQLIQRKNGQPFIPGIFLIDHPVMTYRGAIEGFYGKPWSHQDRLNLLTFFGRHKMNTYVYAAKDDPYLRDRWRDSYPKEELKKIQELVQASREHHIDFVYTISPGLDICFSCEKEFKLLIQKAESMWQIGVRHFALLLDDISLEMKCESDKDMFASYKSPAAAAHAFLLNRFYKEFILTHSPSNSLLTVPTDYYQGETTDYRELFSELVHPDIRVYWTGIGIAPATITIKDADKISSIFKHPLLLWDNYPVTDYIRERLFLGPLEGRDAGLADHGVIGLTANPMEHAESSKLALFTIADYVWNPKAYDPFVSWEASLKEFGGPVYPELRRFAENNLSSAVRETESPTLTKLIQALWKSLDSGKAEKEARTLIFEFLRLEQLPQKISAIQNNSFLREIEEWLLKIKHYGIAGQAAVHLLTAIAGNLQKEAKEYLNQLQEQLAKDTVDVYEPVTRASSRKLDGINRIRGTNELIQYTPEYGPRTETNEWGYEITVRNGKIVKQGANNNEIPPDGYVLSLHSEDWLKNNSIVGAKVSIDHSEVTILIEKGIYPVPNKKVLAAGVMEPFLNRVLKAYSLWNGGDENKGPFSSLSPWKDYKLRNMTDGRPDTFFWSNGAPKEGDYVGVHLGHRQDIHRIELYMGAVNSGSPQYNDYIHQGKMEISDNGFHWISVGAFTGQRDIIIDLSPGTQCKMVRFRCTSEQVEWVQIREFTVK